MAPSPSPSTFLIAAPPVSYSFGALPNIIAVLSSDSSGTRALGSLVSLGSTLARVETQSAPFEASGRYFAWIRTPEDELAVLKVREGTTGDDRVLLDPNPLSPDHTTQAGLESMSRDGRLMVYSIRRSGKDASEPRVRDVATGADAADVMPEGLYRSVALDGDARGFYYALQDRATGSRIRYHALGTQASADLEVFGSGYGPSEWVEASVSENGRHLVITVAHGWQRDEIWVQDLPANGPPRPIVNGLDGHFAPTYAGDRLIVQTDWQAPRGRIVEIDPVAPAPERWREIVPQRDDAAAGFDGTAARSSSTSPATPCRARPTASTSRRARSPAGGGPRCRSTARPTRPSRSGTRRATAPRSPCTSSTARVWSATGERPLCSTATAASAARSCRRSARATPGSPGRRHRRVANLRGGSEFGEAWHKAGMLDKKQNVFDDFIAAGEHLARERYTSPERLAIAGVSNGGLLVGAALPPRASSTTVRPRSSNTATRASPRSSLSSAPGRPTRTCAQAPAIRRCSSPPATPTRASRRHRRAR
jgi:prolyl oligopeptidase